ncbi:hypothetical protein TBLA_0F03080 [Henningerozyma blattae CBS 6284]|uniref:GPI transamidase component GAA1 n=1 Tax=Henningerozyma blattae (strain ATCC 34711 / CBS 6284 / DSM 70876 / NBRC 10599 / NRRL Y-10934 / UCD 77-7) TaxID=1071380 RepID=I2H645_HENB6|nr:hypothetical protein TBLA_0F03080 [Tetrapisispora blattae CBS 6284]CCH61847.1 hypothetical protein TBLA_0F03080 [Tetrapisispora blattae CBS 6284]
MALLATIHRRVIDMGLVPKIMKRLPLVSIFLAAIGIVLFLMLPMDGQYRHTYISENALMPSQAYSYFRESEWNILRGYRTEIDIFPSMPSRDRNLVMTQWLEEFGTKTSVYHNDEYGDTLYGIFNAPRGDGTEAIVLAIPWYNADGEFNTGGAALGIALSRFFSRWPIWSKNIIVVFSENPDGALRSWVDAYHHSLDLTGGSIEAAIVMDYPSSSDFFDYVEIYYHGINGELPNLDLLNIAIQITEHEGMQVSLHGLPKESLHQNNYFSRLRTLLLGTKDALLSGIKPRHGNEAFSGFRIQAITLKAKFTPDNNDHDITSFGRIAEASFRSVNNLLEKFHQSFFFYLILAPKYFVSISSYLPSAVTFSVAFAISSLSSYINNSYSTLPIFSEYNLLAGLLFTISITFSFFVARLSLLFTEPRLLVLGSVFLSVLPHLLGNRFTIPEPLSYRLKSIAFLYISLVLTSLLVLNFSLAFGIGILGFAMTAVKTITIHSSMRVRVRNTMHLLLSNPFTSVLLFTYIFDKDIYGIKIFYEFIHSWNTLNCWTWFIICVGWLPPWILVSISSIQTNTVMQSPDYGKKQL